MFGPKSSTQNTPLIELDTPTRPVVHLNGVSRYHTMTRTKKQTGDAVLFGRWERYMEMLRKETWSLRLKSRNWRGFHWRWDVMSVGRMAGEILSKQLFMPMVTLATVVSGIGQSVDDASEDTLRTVAERKASTAKVMPAHHLRGFISRPGVQTILKSIAQVDAAPTVSGFELPASKLASTPSFDMADPPDESPVRDIGLHSRVPTSLLGDSLNRSDGFGARKGKGRDGTDEDEGGSIRKMRRGATPRRSDVLALETPTTRRSSFPRSLIDPDSTTTEAETTRELSTGGNNSYSQTMDEDDIGAPAAASSQPPPPPSSRLASASPKLSREKEKPKLARAPPRAPVDNSDVFGATQTQTQASSDDSDREAELARRVRAAGAIGSAAVRTPAGGLGSRMVRKKF
ncbi:hypothetical protein FRC10_009194 [Ceratobasidium sp. 414]|nr:hypothetical protein FRC10_009194 [Ceratobasidium sp. 414]